MTCPTPFRYPWTRALAIGCQVSLQASLLCWTHYSRPRQSEHTAFGLGLEMLGNDMSRLRWPQWPRPGRGVMLFSLCRRGIRLPASVRLCSTFSASLGVNRVLASLTSRKRQHQEPHRAYSLLLGTHASLRSTYPSICLSILLLLLLLLLLHA